MYLKESYTNAEEMIEGFTEKDYEELAASESFKIWFLLTHMQEAKLEGIGSHERIGPTT